ncbi:hypothetical protein I79_014669 [Cricetulus griseus]|uniref:Uncharacterized protein n=1 Tax=Cricetulus griseus TaxID=10029 RepID=G3HUQ5_CRIGR|nr:hypothetical protein I79_014669 [Cricetulus griseus]
MQRRGRWRQAGSIRSGGDRTSPGHRQVHFLVPLLISSPMSPSSGLLMPSSSS